MSEAGSNESDLTPPDGSRGAVQEAEIRFAYRATLRIFGAIANLDEIDRPDLLVQEK